MDQFHIEFPLAPSDPVEQDDAFHDEQEAASDHLAAPAVLARFPNVSQKAAVPAPSQPVTARLWWRKRSVAFWTLAGATAVLLVAAVAPYLLGWKSSSSSQIAGDSPPAWQPEVPAPNAEVAPAWAPPKALAETDSAVKNAPHAPGVAVATPPAASPTTAAALETAANHSGIAAASVPPAPKMQAAQPPAPTAKTPEAATDKPHELLTWQAFSRQFEERRAAAKTPDKAAVAWPSGVAVPNSPTAPATAQDVPAVANRALMIGTATATRDAAAPEYPTTNNPDVLTVGPSVIR